MEISPINMKSWKKKPYFDSLATTMKSHMDNLSIPELVTVVSTNLPLDNTTAFIEVDVVKKDNLRVKIIWYFVLEWWWRYCKDTGIHYQQRPYEISDIYQTIVHYHSTYFGY